jgi:NADH:ubiquinone oxidoreductase subunit K
MTLRRFSGFPLAVSGAISSERRVDWLGDWAAFAAVGAAFAGSALMIAYFGVTQARIYYAEGGLIESVTAILLIVVAVLLALWRAPLGMRSYVPSLILLLMTVRELDGDKWFTEKSVTSTGYYFDNPGVPYTERLFFGAIVFTLGVIGLHFLWAVRRQALRALRQLQPYCRSVLVGLAMIVASLVMDGLRGKVFAVTGIHLSEMTGFVSGIGEETAELGMILAFLVAVLQLRFDPARNALPRPGA